MWNFRRPLLLPSRILICSRFCEPVASLPAKQGNNTKQNKSQLHEGSGVVTLFQACQWVSVSGADLAAAKEQSRAANWNDCRPNGINPSRIVSGSGVGCVMSAMTRMREPKLPCSCHARPAPICVSNDCGPCSQFESPSNTLSLSLTRPSLCPLGGFSFSFSVRTCSHLMTS